MQIPLLDLKAQYRKIKEECLKVTADIYESQYFILGPHVDKLEVEIAKYCASQFAVGVSSGTDALLLALMAAEIRPGDRVITTPYTFFATAGCVSRVGAIPLFVDIDPDTYNISPEGIRDLLAALKKKEKKTVKAIMPVHLYGQCADMDPILEIAGNHKMLVIEDAAQAIGAEYKGRRAGAMGDIGCFSFFPSKNLGGFGDGGVMTTNSKDLYDVIKILRVHGGYPKYYHQRIGGNFRLDALQAAIVSIKLKYLDDWTTGRQKNAATYKRLIAGTGLSGIIKCPVEKETRHIYNQFVIEVPGKRDELRQFLTENGVGNEVYYPVPLHLQECFKYLGYTRGDFPVSEHTADHSLALPIYPELSEEQIVYIVDQLKNFYN
jgi:dTDP-4-amino-4,6-dideoxygalactose transaminase